LEDKTHWNDEFEIIARAGYKLSTDVPNFDPLGGSD
jgi:hypothetical protein